MWRFRQEGRLLGPLTFLLTAGTLPGVVVGGIIRVTWLSDSHSFMYVASAVLLPLGLWLLLGSQRLPPEQPKSVNRAAIWGLALAVGVLGGIYGIGGGSLLAPILIAFGFSVYEVAPATITATFITSVAGIATYQILQFSQGGAIAPEWILGAFLGAGGLAGSYCGARLQSHVPEQALRRLLGLVACVVAARYLQTASDGAARVRDHSGWHATAGSRNQAVRRGIAHSDQAGSVPAEHWTARAPC